MKDEKGRFVKGNDGKPKGAENKVTQRMKELFLQTLEETSSKHKPNI